MLKNKLLSAMGGAPANYIEDVFSTWLYTGNGSTQTITNGIDLAGKGGLVWRKLRSAAGDHILEDTVRGAGNYLLSNATNAQANSSALITSFNTTGFTTGAGSNANGSTYVSWTFRKQPKFFDVVTYTGDDNFSGRQIAHNLGSVPGCILIKKTSGAKDWEVWHRSLTDGAYVQLNSTAAQTGAGGFDYFGASATQTSTYFTLGDLNDDGVNRAGATYVAYLFAHNAGGFGLTGNDNVISCGSYTGNGTAGNAVTLGYEPQFVMIKRADATGNWLMQDVMRGIPNSGSSYYLYANTSDAETDGGVPTVIPTATGFTLPSFGGWNASGGTFIYIAIRRGPMKVPTTGTSVFTPVARAGTNSVAVVDAGFPPDLFIDLNRDHLYFANNPWFDRLRGLVYSNSNSTAAESDGSPFLTAYGQTGVTLTNSGLNSNATTYITYSMRRAPGYMDVCCYTGTGSGQTVNHNLGAVPELMIVKRREGPSDWFTYIGTNTSGVYLNTTGTPITSTAFWNNTSPTSSVFTVGGSTGTVGYTYVAYLFASAPGVSKVGSYTGNGSSQTVNCGFAAGARFVMIKRTDSASPWWTYDTARGITSGNDPVLLMNSTAAEDGSFDTLDPESSGFIVNSDGVGVNVNGGTYIFLAIA